MPTKSPFKIRHKNSVGSGDLVIGLTTSRSREEIAALVAEGFCPCNIKGNRCPAHMCVWSVEGSLMKSPKLRLNFADQGQELRLAFGRGCVLVSIVDIKAKLFAGIVLSPEDAAELAESLEILRKAARDAAGSTAS